MLHPLPTCSLAVSLALGSSAKPRNPEKKIGLQIPEARAGSGRVTGKAESATTLNPAVRQLPQGPKPILDSPVGESQRKGQALMLEILVPAHKESLQNSVLAQEAVLTSSSSGVQTPGPESREGHGGKKERRWA